MAEPPRLRTAVRPIRRSAGSVQFGLSPGADLVLTGLAAPERAFVEGLDGRQELELLKGNARRDGVDAERLDQILAALGRHGLLEERPAFSPLTRTESIPGAWPVSAADVEAAIRVYGGAGELSAADRGRRWVLVDGDGNLAEHIAQTLRHGGYGRIWVGRRISDDLDFDVREGTTTDLPHLVVLAAGGPANAARAEPWRRRGVAHLPVSASAHRLVIGPLVLPGSACVRCCDLFRSDRDPGWPLVLAQAAASFAAAPAAVDSALAALGAGLVTMLSRAYLDAEAHLPGMSLEVTLPDPTVVRRKWDLHPRCDCHDDARVTMGP